MHLARAGDFDQRHDLFLQHVFQQFTFFGGFGQHALCPVRPGYKIGLPCFQQRAFRRNNVGGALREHVRHVKFEQPCHLGLKAQAPDFKRADLILKLIDRGLELGAMQPRQNIAFFHDIALAHGKFGQNTTFEVLNNLRART